MISLQVVLFIHQNLTKEYCGSDGIRNIKALESAISRPFSTFDSEELYKAPIEKHLRLLKVS